MHLPDFTEATLWTRLLAALVTLIALAGTAAISIVFAMMLVLFSADGSGSADFKEIYLERAAITVGVALGVAVLLPPLMLLFRMSATHSLIPAGLGFLVAGGTTLWFVVLNLGGQ
ncbi:MAG: hypothetical protein AAGG44_17685 [Planctomycetota bacterium]